MTRGASHTRSIFIVCVNSVSLFSVNPVIGAALPGSGEQASGMWPSPAKRPEVASRPIQPGARQVDLAPCVEVGEVDFGARRPVERFHVGLELDQVTRDEARGEPQVAQKLHQEPAGIAARSARVAQGHFRRLDAGLHADEIADVLCRRWIRATRKSTDGVGSRGIEARYFSNSGVGGSLTR